MACKLIGYFTQRTSHLREGIRKTMELVRGGYAMALINGQALYAFRDPLWYSPSRPRLPACRRWCSWGRVPSDPYGRRRSRQRRGWVVASETCALDIVGATYVRDIRPGEILRISAEGLVSEQGVPAAHELAECIFEQVYFARPDSIMAGKSVYACRYDMGRQLAREAPVDADMVIGVPDSGLPPAEGYASESGIPFGEGLIKNRYVARTFIQPTQELRAMGVRMKLNPLRDNIAGKRLVVIDDSIVRGTTMVQLVRMLRQAGAAEVHVRINSPEVVWLASMALIPMCRHSSFRLINRLSKFARIWCGFAGVPLRGGLASVHAGVRGARGAGGVRRSCGWCEWFHFGMPGAWLPARRALPASTRWPFPRALVATSLCLATTRATSPRTRRFRATWWWRRSTTTAGKRATPKLGWRSTRVLTGAEQPACIKEMCVVRCLNPGAYGLGAPAMI